MGQGDTYMRLVSFFRGIFTWEATVPRLSRTKKMCHRPTGRAIYRQEHELRRTKHGGSV